MRSNFASNYWGGDYALTDSFWLVYWPWHAALRMAGMLPTPPAADAWITGVFAAMYIWLFGGLWRSAGKDRGTWGGSARGWVILSVFLSSLRFASNLADFH